MEKKGKKSCTECQHILCVEKYVYTLRVQSDTTVIEILSESIMHDAVTGCALLWQISFHEAEFNNKEVWLIYYMFFISNALFHETNLFGVGFPANM